MAELSTMPKDVADFVRMYRWHGNDPVPWAVWDRRLSESRIGLVVMACMVMPDQEPFDAEKPGNDPSLRVIPEGTDPAVLVNTFAGQAFDHSGLFADADLLVPLDRMRELADRQVIGALGLTISLCGHLPKPQLFIDETAPRIAGLFADDGSDAALLVPA